MTHKENNMKTVIIHDLLASNDIIDQFGWTDVEVVVALDHNADVVVGADTSAEALRDRMLAAGYTVVYEDDAYRFNYTYSHWEAILAENAFTPDHAQPSTVETTVSDENSLMYEIINKWGEFGAHADVYASVLAEKDELRRTQTLWEACAKAYERGDMGLGDRLFKEACK
jgi:hypothetical protein